MTQRELAQKIIDISIEAGKEILEVYKLDFDVDFKQDDSPVTVADKRAHKVIQAGLEKITPDIPIISEEGTIANYSERKSWEKCWMVDPLDGTKEFIKKNGEFTVNIAMIENHTPILSVVYTPATGEVYAAIKGEGAYKVEDGNWNKLQVKTVKKSDENLRIVCSRSHVNADTQAYIDQFNNPQQVAIGSSLKLTKIAEDLADIYPRLGPTMEWDIAAAELVLTEAGGTVVTVDGTPMRYNKEDLLNPFFIASTHIAK